MVSSSVQGTFFCCFVFCFFDAVIWMSLALQALAADIQVSSTLLDAAD